MNRSSLPPYRPYSEIVPAYTPTSPISPSTPQHPINHEITPTVHEYHLLNKDKPWVTLAIYSDASSYKNLPKFFEGTEVAGTMSLRLGNGDYIQAITISLKGRVITGAGATDSYTFLDHTQTLWSRTMGDPRSTAHATDGKYSGKLVGDYMWPFSFPFPTNVSMSAGSGAPQVYHLPQTFLERGTSANIQYDLVLHISRGVLRADSKIQTQVAYVPTIIPRPSSMLRQRAYLENTPVPGPDDDPEGWCTLRPTIIRGHLFNARPSEVKCTLSLAKPLSYANGTVIPCHLIIRSLDSQALDLLASPKAINVRLRRRVKYFLAAAQALSKKQDIASKTAVEDVETAVWCLPSERSGNGMYECRLEGEIHLSRDLKPSSSFAPFTIEYFVVLLPFESAGFMPADTEPSLTQPVEIATVHSMGPRPRAYTTAPSKEVEVNYLHLGYFGGRPTGFAGL